MYLTSPGFYLTVQNKRAKKGSGGVGIFIKSTFKSHFYVRALNKSYDGILACEFNHKKIANLINKLNFYKLIPYPMDNC